MVIMCQKWFLGHLVREKKEKTMANEMRMEEYKWKKQKERKKK